MVSANMVSVSMAAARFVGVVVKFVLALSVSSVSG